MIVSACMFILGYAMTWAPYVSFVFIISFYTNQLSGVSGFWLERPSPRVLELSREPCPLLLTGYGVSILDVRYYGRHVLMLV